MNESTIFFYDISQDNNINEETTLSLYKDLTPFGEKEFNSSSKGINRPSLISQSPDPGEAPIGNPIGTALPVSDGTTMLLIFVGIYLILSLLKRKRIKLKSS